jgi:hypothetical protein
MRDFGVRGWEGSGTAILAVTDTGKMPAPRRAPCRACSGKGGRGTSPCVPGAMSALDTLSA